MPAPTSTPSDLTELPPRRRGLLAATACAVLAVDVLSKVWAVATLSDSGRKLLGGLLVLHVTRNPGAAFSFAGGATVVFTLVAIGVIAVILRSAGRLRSTGWAVTLGLLLGGAAGNLADRLFRDPGPFRGHVVDFLDLHWNGRSIWPVFNVADMAIVGGGALALLLAWRGVEIDGSRPDADQPGDDERHDPAA